jgi:hypothetical protein
MKKGLQFGHGYWRFASAQLVNLTHQRIAHQGTGELIAAIQDHSASVRGDVMRVTAGQIPGRISWTQFIESIDKGCKLEWFSNSNVLARFV